MSKKKQTLREAINEQYDKAVEGTLETPSGISDDQKEVFMIGAAWAYRNASNMLGKPLTLKEFATKKLDSSNGLAVAVCHHFNSEIISTDKYNSG